MYDFQIIAMAEAINKVTATPKEAIEMP